MQFDVNIRLYEYCVGGGLGAPLRPPGGPGRGPGKGPRVSPPPPPRKLWGFEELLKAYRNTTSTNTLAMSSSNRVVVATPRALFIF
jgi:hypothetical protein